MYSAVSVGGRRLYDLARQGIEVERKPRRITVEELELLDGEGDSYTLRILCSKGTYVRSLVSDLGEALGCGAVLTDLVRTRSGPYTLKACITLEEAQAKREELASLLLPVELSLIHIWLERQAQTASPILSNGDVVGYAVLLQGDGTASATEAECKLTVAGAAFLGRQIEG